mgnify:CR=1 FL=1
MTDFRLTSSIFCDELDGECFDFGNCHNCPYSLQAKKAKKSKEELKIEVDGRKYTASEIHDIFTDYQKQIAKLSKTGHCIIDSEGYERCSNCNMSENNLQYFNFCPHCGANLENWLYRGDSNG